MSPKDNISQAFTALPDNILKELFYQMDTQIMISDIETDEILYANEKENARLKKIVAEQALDIAILKDVNSKNF